METTGTSHGRRMANASCNRSENIEPDTGAHQQTTTKPAFREIANSLAKIIRRKTYARVDLCENNSVQQDIRIFDCVPKADLKLSDADVKEILKKD